MNELVSIIWTTHHEPIDTIKWSLDSLDSQTYQNCEFILINDSSIISGAHEYLNYYTNTHPRFKYIHLKENVGYSRAKNVGVSASTGKYTVIIDADIAIRPDFVEHAINTFNAHKDCYVVEGASLKLHPTGSRVKDAKSDRFIYDRYPNNPVYFFSIGAFLTTKKVILNSGLFQENLELSDVILFVNMHMQYSLKRHMKNYQIEYPEESRQKYPDWEGYCKDINMNLPLTNKESFQSNRASNILDWKFWNNPNHEYIGYAKSYGEDLLKNNGLYE